MLEVVDYCTSWPSEFQCVAQTVFTAIGALALRIDHIGSTAVPRLCAKDIIDVQVTVQSLSTGVVQDLQASGYVHRPGITQDHVPPGYEGPVSDWAKLFFLQPVGNRRANVHVRLTGRPNQRYALLFRDFLRANHPTAAAYGELKRRLAASLARDEAYPDVKDPAVDLIYFAAEAWAKQTNWKLPASDFAIGPRD